MFIMYCVSRRRWQVMTAIRKRSGNRETVPHPLQKSQFGPNLNSQFCKTNCYVIRFGLNLFKILPYRTLDHLALTSWQLSWHGFIVKYPESGLGKKRRETAVLCASFNVQGNAWSWIPQIQVERQPGAYTSFKNLYEVDVFRGYWAVGLSRW